ncbi:MAG: bifunctional metallophosphatase/5'-nucleotidase [Candidatus Carbobacillus altaicus]|nr:bifunctional metallophosphatase/5'-nucleotidase [Candidatus Carbobacillus altaicus]
MRVHMLHTNDVHSHIQMFPLIGGAIERLKRELGERLIVLDLGDHVDRVQPLSDITEGMMNRSVLEASGYDLVTIGNNEGLTLSPLALGNLYRDAAFEVILSNLRTAEGVVPTWLKPYTLIRVEDVTLGFFGLTAAFHYYPLLGWTVDDPYERARELSRFLRPQVDVLILLSHLGFYADRTLAQADLGIDLILGAHTHHRFPEGVRIGRTLLTQAGKGGRELGWTILDYTPGEDLTMRTQLIDVTKEAPSARILRTIDEVQQTEGPRLKRVVATLKAPLTISYERSSPYARLLAEILRRETGADASIVTSGLLLHGLEEGPVTYGDILSSCPHPITTCILRMPAIELKEILFRALNPQLFLRPIHGFGFRGEILGYPVIAGLEWDRGASEEIRLYDARGEVEDERMLSVAWPDMLLFRDPYDSFKASSYEANVTYCLPDFLRHYLERALQDDALVWAVRLEKTTHKA